MTHEQKQRIMQAAGVAPISHEKAYFINPDGVVHRECSPEEGQWAAQGRLREGWTVLLESPIYPDPESAKGFLALWDALAAKGWFVRVCTTSSGLTVARVGPTPGPGIDDNLRWLALARAAAQALGVELG